MLNIEKEIKDFPNYFITTDGKVISKKFKEPRIMKTWKQHGGGYENIKLCKENKTYHFLIHRLVAEAFIPNPNNYPEVNHINRDTTDNRVENLEWCSRKMNIAHSLKVNSPVRNYRKCQIIDTIENKTIGEFISASEACRFAEKNLNCKYSTFRRYLRANHYIIEFIEV